MKDTKKYKLTISITTYYKSDPLKLFYMLNSLFSNEFDDKNIFNITKENILKSSQIIQKNLNKLLDKLVNNKLTYIENLKVPIELILIIDNTNPPLNYEENINKLIEVFDKFKPIVKRYCDSRYILCDRNVKVSVARNKIIDESLGEYLIFCDDDDLRCNVSSIIDIIEKKEEKNKKINYISHYFLTYSYLNKDELTYKIQISNLSCWSAIINTNFLRKNKLYLTPDLASEDVVWRGNLDYIFTYNPNKDTIITQQANNCCYIYMDASNRSLNNNINNNRFLNNLDINVKNILNKSNDDYYIEFDKIYKQYLEIGFKFTEWRLYSSTASVSFYKGYNIILQWMLTNKEQIKSSSYDYNMILLSEEISKEFDKNYEKYNKLFLKLTQEDKKIIFELLIKYISIPDLKKMCNYIDPINSIEILDSLWKYILDYEIYLDKFISYKQFNEFVYRFVLLRSLYIESYSKLINNDVVLKMYKNYKKEIEFIPINEILNFIHDFLLRKIGFSDVYNYFSDEKIKFTDIKQKFKDCYQSINNDELINKFIKENTLETTTLGQYDKHYKGPINIFLFYVLTPRLMN